MKLDVVRLTLGPLPNNVYLLGDTVKGDAVVIDPGFDSHFVLARAKRLGWTLRQIWLTHGHFDHFAGAATLLDAIGHPLPIGLHPDDYDWYADQGGAEKFGLSIPQPPVPTVAFEDGMQLKINPEDALLAARVLHAPGHSAGHVMFYCEALGVLFCGDVIFHQGIGRTDLRGGSHAVLLESIEEKVMSLPDETRLLPGHGPESTVGYERTHNPFL